MSAPPAASNCPAVPYTHRSRHITRTPGRDGPTSTPHGQAFVFGPFSEDEADMGNSLVAAGVPSPIRVGSRFI
jgi:hypothetical protein